MFLVSCFFVSLFLFFTERAAVDRSVLQRFLHAALWSVLGAFEYC